MTIEERLEVIERRQVLTIQLINVLPAIITAVHSKDPRGNLNNAMAEYKNIIKRLNEYENNSGIAREQDKVS